MKTKNGIDNFELSSTRERIEVVGRGRICKLKLRNRSFASFCMITLSHFASSLIRSRWRTTVSGFELPPIKNSWVWTARKLSINGYSRWRKLDVYISGIPPSFVLTPPLLTKYSSVKSQISYGQNEGVSKSLKYRRLRKEVDSSWQISAMAEKFASGSITNISDRWGILGK